MNLNIKEYKPNKQEPKLGSRCLILCQKEYIRPNGTVDYYFDWESAWYLKSIGQKNKKVFVDDCGDKDDAYTATKDVNRQGPRNN